jgi:nicotinamide riboside transporter PnuC
MSILAWVAFVFAVLGAYLAAKKKASCWWVWLVTNILWSIYAYQTKQWPILLTEIVFVVSNIYGIICWKKDKHE